MMPDPLILSRRTVLGGTGALMLNFSLWPAEAQQQQNPTEAQNAGNTPPNVAPLPGSLKDSPFLDSWIKIDAKGEVTVITGKAELGQGIKTAILQVAAEEIEVPLARLRLITADTGLTPNEGYTAGSQSTPNSATAVRHAAAQVRAILIGQAAERSGQPPESFKAQEGRIVGSGGQGFGYGELVSETLLHVRATAPAPLKEPGSLTVIGKPVRRVDIPGKVTGGEAYVQDMRLPGMVHARMVRPPSYGARLTDVDTAAVERMPGFIKVVRDGDFLAVVCAKEFQAVKAMRALAAAAKWAETPSLPKQAELAAAVLALPSQDTAILDQRQPGAAGTKTVEATYTRPYQAHGSIGPSCAVAQANDSGVTVWTHTQGVYPDRAAIAELLRLPPAQVRCIHVEGSGCYGHNGADDVAADAAVIARALPGRPVRVQWMREQEHGWEPFGPAMVTKARASLDASGGIADWSYEVWSNTHSMRPGGAGSTLAGQTIAQRFAVPDPKPLPLPDGGGDRNAIPFYKFPSAYVMHHFIPKMPVRVSALRALGAYANIFSIESFMDELALEAGADPVEFRLRHLEDARGRDVIAKAAEAFGWQKGKAAPAGRGYGFAFARYKNHAAYCAVGVEVEVQRETGRARVVRAVAAVDSGQVINPDGLTNQIEGAIMQSASWTLYERVTFDETRITSIDWSTYPILRFNAVPEKVEVHIINRPGQPFLGSGECGQGPAAAAIGNAVAHATGKRIRDLPLSRERIRATVGI